MHKFKEPEAEVKWQAQLS